MLSDKSLYQIYLSLFGLMLCVYRINNIPHFSLVLRNKRKIFPFTYAIALKGKEITNPAVSQFTKQIPINRPFPFSTGSQKSTLLKAVQRSVSSYEWWRHSNLTISSFNVLIPLKRHCLRDRLQSFQMSQIQS